MRQIQMFLEPVALPVMPEQVVCDEHLGFYTHACVPGGLWCMTCKAVVMRDLPPPENEPELLGYESATWAYKYKYGNDWTVDKPDWGR